MSIEGICVEGSTLRINGQMGVWNAQIILLPEEVAAMVGFLLQPKVIGYMARLPWRLRVAALGRMYRAASNSCELYERGKQVMCRSLSTKTNGQL